MSNGFVSAERQGNGFTTTEAAAQGNGITTAEFQNNGIVTDQGNGAVIIPFPSSFAPFIPFVTFPKRLPEGFTPEMGTDMERRIIRDHHPGKRGTGDSAYNLNGGPDGARPPRPDYLFSPKPSAALDYLKTFKQWVVWDYVYRDGRWAKVPQNVYQTNKFKWGEAKYWGSYDDAVGLRNHLKGHTGIGFIISPEDDITGIDLDGCLDPVTMKLEPWAQEIVDYNETYCEISPSTKGLRIFAKGKIDRTRKSNEAGTEVYRSGRFLTVTGNPLPGAPTAICEAPKTIAAALARIEQFKPAPPPREARDPDEEKSFFWNVNEAALGDLIAWAPELFPGGTWNGITFRVSEKVLRRGLQEDISIHPEGIRDWGLNDQPGEEEREGRRTPIDLVIDWREQEDDALSAAMWLCEKMKIDPTTLGYYDYNIPEEASREYTGPSDWLEQEIAARGGTTHEDKPTEEAIEFPEGLQPVDIKNKPGISDELYEAVKIGGSLDKTGPNGTHWAAWEIMHQLIYAGISATDVLSIFMDDHYGISKNWGKDRPYIEEQIRTGFKNKAEKEAKEKAKAEAPPPRKRRKNYEEFCASFTPPVNIIGNIIQQGYLYFLTARAFHAKTLTAVSMMHAVATRKQEILGIEIEQQGRAAYVMLENPDDTKKRVMAQRFYYGLNERELRDQITIIDEFVCVDPRTKKAISALDGAYRDLMDDCKEKGPLTIVFIDLWQACFSGESFNENAEMLQLAQKCRTFTKLPGNPAVIVLAHPVKNATEDNLVPYGGGSAFNEFDCNLTNWKDEKTNIIKWHWFRKFRGTPFEPIFFTVKPIKCPQLVDSKGRQFDVPILEPADAGVEEGREQMQRQRQAKLLVALLDHPGASYREIEEIAGIPIASAKRLFVNLEKLHLVEKTIDGYRLTKKGKTDATEIKNRPF